jgi:hypothetical protein
MPLIGFAVRFGSGTGEAFLGADRVMPPTAKASSATTDANSRATACSSVTAPATPTASLPKGVQVEGGMLRLPPSTRSCHLRLKCRELIENVDCC